MAKRYEVTAAGKLHMRSSAMCLIPLPSGIRANSRGGRNAAFELFFLDAER